MRAFPLVIGLRSEALSVSGVAERLGGDESAGENGPKNAE